MTSYVMRYLLSDEVELFEKIRAVIVKLPDLELGCDESGQPIILSCHILARAVGKVFDLEVVDGTFCGSYLHSWLIIGRKNIIDVYPVAMLGGPLLIHGGYDHTGFRHRTPCFLYREDGSYFSSNAFSYPSFLEAVDLVTASLQEIRTRLE